MCIYIYCCLHTHTRVLTSKPNGMTEHSSLSAVELFRVHGTGGSEDGRVGSTGREAWKTVCSVKLDRAPLDEVKRGKGGKKSGSGGRAAGGEGGAVAPVAVHHRLIKQHVLFRAISVRRARAPRSRYSPRQIQSSHLTFRPRLTHLVCSSLTAVIKK